MNKSKIILKEILGALLIIICLSIAGYIYAYMYITYGLWLGIVALSTCIVLYDYYDRWKTNRKIRKLQSRLRRLQKIKEMRENAEVS